MRIRLLHVCEKVLRRFNVRALIVSIGCVALMWDTIAAYRKIEMGFGKSVGIYKGIHIAKGYSPESPIPLN